MTAAANRSDRYYAKLGGWVIAVILFAISYGSVKLMDYHLAEGTVGATIWWGLVSLITLVFAVVFLVFTAVWTARDAR